MSQKKAKFNIVDVIVVLVLVVCIAFVGMRMLDKQQSAESATYLLTFKADCVPEEIAARLTVGTDARDNDLKIALGTLEGISTGDSIVYGYDSEGNCVASQKPGHVSVTLLCKVTGYEDATGLMVDRNLISIGSELQVSCGLTMVRATLWDITPVAGE